MTLRQWRQGWLLLVWQGALYAGYLDEDERASSSEKDWSTNWDKDGVDGLLSSIKIALGHGSKCCIDVGGKGILF